MHVVFLRRALLGGICEFLRHHAEQPELSVIITAEELEEATTPRPHDLPAAAAAAEAARALAGKQAAAAPGEAGGLLAGSAGSCVGGSELDWCARGLLRLACKVGGGRLVSHDVWLVLAERTSKVCIAVFQGIYSLLMQICLLSWCICGNLQSSSLLAQPGQLQQPSCEARPAGSLVAGGSRSTKLMCRSAPAAAAQL
jgi:hypothetical protein